MKKIHIALVMLLGGCRGVVMERPSQPGVIVVPTSPGQGFVWIGHSWSWNQQLRTYDLAEGHWVKPKRKTSIWVDGRWRQTRSGWRYIPGHWKKV